MVFIGEGNGVLQQPLMSSGIGRVLYVLGFACVHGSA